MSMLTAFRKISEANSSAPLAATADEAGDAYKRLRKLEEDKPSTLHKLRYATLGAVGTPLIMAGAGAISGKPSLSGSLSGIGRQLASQSFTGAAISGGLPMLKDQMDRETEKKKIRSFLEGRRGEFTTGSGQYRRFRDTERKSQLDLYRKLDETFSKSSAVSATTKYSFMKEAFRKSFYHGTGAWGPRFERTPHMPDPSAVARSQMPAQKVFAQMSQKAASIATTPAGRLRQAKMVGVAPGSKALAGPSIGSISAKPAGGLTFPAAKAGGKI